MRELWNYSNSKAIHEGQHSNRNHPMAFIHNTGADLFILAN